MPPGTTETLASLRNARRLIATLLLCYLVFVVYGSLVPLHYVPLPWDEAVRRFAQVPYLQLGIQSRSDWVANGLLFIPLSYLAMAWIPHHWPLPVKWVLGLLLLTGCAGLATSIEFTQLYFPGRTVSLNDVIAETLGGALGLVLCALTGRRAVGWLQAWWQDELQASRLLRILHLYLVGVLVYAVMPLDLAISPVELAQKFSKGPGISLLPFADWPADPAQLAYKAFTDLALWLPVGLLWHLSGTPVVRAARRGLAAAAIIEALQLFVFSRHSSVTDVLTGGLGAWFGALLATHWLRRQGVMEAHHGKPEGSSAHGASAWVGWLAWCAWLLVALLVFWYPFDFNTAGSFVRPRLAALEQPLLTGYYMGSEYNALTQLLRKSLMFLPGGLAWAMAVLRSPPTWRRQLYVLGLVATVMAAGLVEGGQLMLPEKFADLSDLLFEACGGMIGLAVGRWLFGPVTPIATGPRFNPSTSRGEPSLRRGPARYARGLPQWRVSARQVWTATWIPDSVLALLLAAGLMLVGNQPGMPYNVRELFGGPSGLVVAAVLALVLWSLWTLPLVWVELWATRPESSLRLVILLPLAVMLPSLMMALAMPAESLSDIVGSPVLGWWPGLEQGLRYAALHAVVLLAATGAVWFVVYLASPVRFELLSRWWLVTLVWAVPLHWVIVEWACTDNLVELMRDGGSAAASALLFAGLTLLFVAGFGLAALACGLGRRHRDIRLPMAVALAWCLATSCLWFGSESLLNKYGSFFSAAQFLFSTDRAHYATTPELWTRFALASLGLAVAAAVLQAPRWRRLGAKLRWDGGVEAAARG